MKRYVIAGVFSILGHLGAMPAAAAEGPLLAVAAYPDALYTPGRIRLTFELTPVARLAGPYHLRVTIYVAQNAVRDQTLTIVKGHPASYELSFPRMHEVTQARYRVELSQAGEFLEASEGPIRLWPPRDLPRVAQRGTRVWVLDTSGALQALLPEFGVTAADAGFQAIRDFGHPDIIFVGEYLDSTSMQILAERVAAAPGRLVVVLLRQRQFYRDIDVVIGEKTDPCSPTVPEPNSVLLKGLCGRDVMRLLSDANAVKVRRYPDRSIDSHLTALGDAQSVRSYLCTVREGNCIILFCQLPAVAHQDPRQMTLVHNIVQFACDQVGPAEPNEPARSERGKP
jgi:hypothetical protein